MKKEVSPGIIAVAVVVVLALIGAVAYMTMGKKQDMPNKNASNPNYEKYMSGAGSGGGPGHATGAVPGPGSPTSAGH